MGKISDQHPIFIRKHVITTIRVHIIYFNNGSAHSTREWLKPCFLAICDRAVGKLYTYVSRANAHDDALRTTENCIELSMHIKTNENNVTDGQHLKKFASSFPMSPMSNPTDLSSFPVTNKSMHNSGNQPMSYPVENSNSNAVDVGGTQGYRGQAVDKIPSIFSSHDVLSTAQVEGEHKLELSARNFGQ